MYSERSELADQIELADETLAANHRVRAHSEHLRAETLDLLLTYRTHRFVAVSGGSDARDEKDVRRAMRDFCTVTVPPKLYAGFSRGSVCQVCGKIIKPGEIEYDAVAAMSEMRLDGDCYKLFMEESRAVEAQQPSRSK